MFCLGRNGRAQTVTKEGKSFFHTELPVLQLGGRKWSSFRLQGLQSREPEQAIRKQAKTRYSPKV
jgi:hypothetical protein